MGFLKKLNNTIKDVEATHDEMEKTVDKLQWTDKDLRNNKKSKIWSTLNLIGVIILAVVVPFVLPQALSIGSASSLWVSIIIGCLVLGLFGSINMAIKFAKTKVIGLGAKVYSFLVLGVLLVAVVIDVFVLLFGNL